MNDAIKSRPMRTHRRELETKIKPAPASRPTVAGFPVLLITLTMCWKGAIYPNWSKDQAEKIGSELSLRLRSSKLASSRRTILEGCGETALRECRRARSLAHP